MVPRVDYPHSAIVEVGNVSRRYRSAGGMSDCRDLCIEMRNRASRPPSLRRNARVRVCSIAAERQDATPEVIEEHRLGRIGNGSTPFAGWKEHDAMQNLGLCN